MACCFSAVSSKPRPLWCPAVRRGRSQRPPASCGRGRNTGSTFSPESTSCRTMGSLHVLPRVCQSESIACVHARLHPLWCSAALAGTGKSPLCFHAPTGLRPSRRISFMPIEGDTVLFPLAYFTLLVCRVFFVNLPYLFKC